MVQRKTNPRMHITQVQKAFEADLYHRLIQPRGDDPQPALKGAIVRKVVDEDKLGLREAAGRGTQLAAPELVTQQAAVGVAEQHQFEFPENPRRTAAFEEWLQEKLDRGVLEPVGRQRVVRGGHYTGQYVRIASRQGVKHADRELRRVGTDVGGASIKAALDMPIHRNILESGYVDAYDEVDGVAGALATGIARSLSDGLREGWGPERTAREMNAHVDEGMAGMRRQARRLTSRLYNDHSLARFSQYNVDEVRILTSNPCEACTELAADGPYTLEAARGLLPPHPSCCCCFAPIVQ